MIFLFVLCGFLGSERVHAATVEPPPAYIETHQTQPISPATTTQSDNAMTSSTTASVIPVPPVIVPQELPANQGVVTKDFVVTSVAVTETKKDAQTGTSTAKIIEFQGKANPNTYIVLYIYSMPIVVTVKTDSQGNWKYDLNQELDNGMHQVYIAQIDNTGNVIAKSDPILLH